jgi:hypothetical protein
LIAAHFSLPGIGTGMLLGSRSPFLDLPGSWDWDRCWTITMQAREMRYASTDEATWSGGCSAQLYCIYRAVEVAQHSILVLCACAILAWRDAIAALDGACLRHCLLPRFILFCSRYFIPRLSSHRHHILSSFFCT